MNNVKLLNSVYSNSHSDINIAYSTTAIFSFLAVFLDVMNIAVSSLASFINGSTKCFFSGFSSIHFYFNYV